ncbi:prokaryotic ubiquitin-like protein Pup [Georgenia satyanarayanai]|uniref:Prokaryotic ubiquitin-like protein Pup n=1 Tax=Georgenia satyanarayanai TaxID=860221 RepID=A0A2Y9A065_9MICO|nr:ubiquitin-like protein Pup [Georgenia satyanarayanai]PYG02355.1 ubiquitin-like protein Pup [Georgenia satyanarayanai]SSA37236.1 prokaryotic ubiquitin-like protein Pup [Georgenia satyanarayanai]
MARQEQQRRSEREPEEPTPPPLPAAASAQTQAAELDDLLGEIDSVLETNAESFVRGFVQKGGQ